MGRNKEQIRARVEDEFEPYLVEFEAEVLGKIDQQLTARLDELIDKEDQLKSAVEKSARLANKSQQAAEKYQWNISLQDLLLGLMGGAMGALVVLIMQNFL